MQRFVLWMLVMSAAASASTAHALEVVSRRSVATRLQGDVTAITKNDVTLKPKTGDAVVIPSNDVLLIEWTGESAGFKIARSDEKGGRLQKALEGYQKAAADSADGSDGLKADIAYFIARTSGKQAMGDPAKVDAAIKLLSDFNSAHPQSYHFYESNQLLGNLYLSKKDFANATATFDVLERSPFNAYKMAARIAAARQSLMENNTAAAQTAFEAVTQMAATSPAEESQKQLAQLGVAHCLQLQQKFPDAIQILDKVIEAASPEESRVQAEAYLRQGDCLDASGKTKEALFAYLHVDVLFPGETDLHAEALYHLARLWAAVQQPERGAEAADRLASEYPNSVWTQKVKTPAAE